MPMREDTTKGGGADLSLLEKKIGYSFSDRTLLETALTHASYSNENAVDSYERLEFLGDAVLQIVISRYLFERFDDIPEGLLTKYRQYLVCEGTLARIADELSLGTYLRLGKGEAAGNGRRRPSILADTVESLLAAIYLDGGMAAAEPILLALMRKELDNCVKNRDGDYKTRLQQLVEQDGTEKLEYTVVSRRGPDHAPTYVIEARINSNAVGVGEGRSKHEAEQAAAREALRLFGLLDEGRDGEA